MSSARRMTTLGLARPAASAGTDSAKSATTVQTNRMRVMKDPQFSDASQKREGRSRFCEASLTELLCFSPHARNFEVRRPRRLLRRHRLAGQPVVAGAQLLHLLRVAVGEVRLLVRVVGQVEQLDQFPPAIERRLRRG